MSNVRMFGAAGDGMMDDTDAIEHALRDGDGIVEFPRGEYKVNRTIPVELNTLKRIAIRGEGGTAKLVMHGPGPLFDFRGTHAGTADPGSFKPGVWERERMPMISDLEIEGRHPEADGVLLVGTVQATISGVQIRQVRDAIRLTGRNRNLLVSHCHIYNNKGIGIHLDHVNLHQVIISASHISYCRLGGIRITGGEIRNVQITGNDIEYNNNKAHAVPGADAVPTAEITIDAEDGSIREGTITSNTIQATYSPGGANIRFIGRNPRENHKAGMWTIASNLIGSQEVNVHLVSAQGITVTGNYIYSGHQRNLLAENCRDLVITGNCCGHNPDYGEKELCTGVSLVDCQNSILSTLQIQDARAGQHTVPNTTPIQREGLIELIRCDRLNVSGCQVIDAAPYGIYIEDARDLLMTGCTILDTRPEKKMKAAIRWKGAASNSQVSGCRLGAGSESTIQGGDGAKFIDNLMDVER